MIYRLIVVQGHFPLVFVVLPFASLFLSYAASAAATGLLSPSLPGLGCLC